MSENNTSKHQVTTMATELTCHYCGCKVLFGSLMIHNFQTTISALRG